MDPKKFILQGPTVNGAQLEVERWLLDHGFTGRKKPKGTGVVAYHYSWRDRHLTLTRTLDSVGGDVDPLWAVDAHEFAVYNRLHLGVRQSKLLPLMEQFFANWQGAAMGLIDSIKAAAQQLGIVSESQEKDFIMQERIPFVVRIRYKAAGIPENTWYYLDHDGHFYTADLYKTSPKRLFRFETVADASSVYERNVRRNNEPNIAKVEFVPITFMGEALDVKNFIMDQPAKFVIAATRISDGITLYMVSPPVNDQWDVNIRRAKRFTGEEAQEHWSAIQNLTPEGWYHRTYKDFRLIPVSSREYAEGHKDVLIGSVVVVHKGKVALVKGKHGWTLPGGRANEDESVFHAAARECEEECSVSVKPADLLFVGMVQRSKHRIDSIFVAELDKEQTAKAGSDADEAMWVSLDNLPQLGFGHAQSIRKALRILRMKPEERGQLVVFEGVDGAGKTTQVERTIEWLKKHGFPVVRTKWASSPIIGDAIKKGKKKRELSPVLYHLMHSADLLHRYEQIICPALARNFVVVCDRYWPTGVVRDRLRGVKNKSCYKKLRKPDVLFFCAVKPEVAVKRLMKAGRLSWYGIGMDINYADDERENATEYSQRMASLYKRVLPARHVPVQMNRKVDDIWKDVKAKLERVLDGHYFRGQNLMERAMATANYLLEVNVRDFIGQQEPLYVIHATNVRDGAKLYWALGGWQPDKLKADAYYGWDAELWMGHAKNVQNALTEPWLKDFGIEVAEKPFDPLEKYRTEAFDVKSFINRQAVIFNIVGTLRQTGERVTYCHINGWTSDQMLPAYQKWRGGGDQAEQWVKILQGENDPDNPAITDIHLEAEIKESFDVKDFITSQPVVYNVVGTRVRTNEKVYWTVGHSWETQKIADIGAHPKWRGGANSAEEWTKKLQFDNDTLPPTIVDIHFEAELKEGLEKDFIVANEPIAYRIGGTDEEGVRRYLTSQRVRDGDWTSDITKASLYTVEEATTVVADILRLGTYMKDVRSEPVDHDDPMSGYWRYNPESIDVKQEIMGGKNHWHLRLVYDPKNKNHYYVDFLCNGENVGTYTIEQERHPGLVRPDDRLLNYWKDQIEALDSWDQYHPADWPNHMIWEWLMKHNLHLDIPAAHTAGHVYGEDRRKRLKNLGWLKEGDEVKKFILRSPAPKYFIVSAAPSNGRKIWLRRYDKEGSVAWTYNEMEATAYPASVAQARLQFLQRRLDWMTIKLEAVYGL